MWHTGKRMLLIKEEVGQNLGTLWVQASAVMFTKNTLAMANSEFWLCLAFYCGLSTCIKYPVDGFEWRTLFESCLKHLAALLESPACALQHSLNESYSQNKGQMRLTTPHSFNNNQLSKHFSIWSVLSDTDEAVQHKFPVFLGNLFPVPWKFQECVIPFKSTLPRGLLLGHIL